MNTKLVFSRHHPNIVSFTQRPIFVDQKLGNQEQRKTLITWSSISHRSQYDMHNIVCHIMLAPGDVNLLPPYQVMVSRWFCTSL